MATNNQASSERDKPSYVNSLHGSYFNVSQLPKLCMKGDENSITIPKEEYRDGLASCQQNFMSQVLLSYQREKDPRSSWISA